jgi:uncharacterized protein DUF1648/PH (Pleckstrin Homology) domain-containing protein
VSDRFPARRSRGGDLATPAAALLLLLALLALAYGVSREPNQLLILLCCVATVLAAIGTLLGLWALGYRRLAYALSDSALRVDWLGHSVVVPYSAIQGIYAGQRLAGNSTPSVPRWPGISVGPRRVRGMGKLRFFATSTDQSQLTLITVEHGGLVVSARDPAEFQTALIQRVERSEVDEAAWFDKAPVDAPWTAVADAWLPICVAIGVVALLITVATIGARYPDLPVQIPLHFDVGGEPSQIGPKSDLLHLPLLGLFCLVVNWALGIVVHPRARVLARLLWLAAIPVQLVLLIGLIRIVA